MTVLSNEEAAEMRWLRAEADTAIVTLLRKHRERNGAPKLWERPTPPVIHFTFDLFDTLQEVRKHVRNCEGRHAQQVIWSTYHDGLTQVCFGCGAVRSHFAQRFNLSQVKH